MNMTKSAQIILKRDGKKDLRFGGIELASSSDRVVNGRGQNRFNQLTAYLTDTGKYVLHRQYITYWQGEANTSEVETFLSKQDLINSLDPAQKVEYDLMEELDPESVVETI